MGGGSGGGGSTSIQDVPPEFKPAYFRLFNSGLAAAQQAAQNPFAGGYPNPYGNYPQNVGTGSGIGAFNPGFQQPQQGLPQPATQRRGLQTGQPRQAGANPQGAPQQQQQGFPQQGGVPGYGIPPLQPGQYPGIGQNNLGWWGAQFQAPPGGTPGSPNIPYSGGQPIIGQPFPGPFTAPSMPIEYQSLAARQQVGNQLGGIANPLLGLGTAQAQGQFLNPYSNPYFQQNIQASLQPAVDAFTRSVLPQFNSQALQAGAYKGSSARDFALGNLANDFGRNLSQTAAQTGFQNYLQERAIQQQTPQLLSQSAQLQQISPEILAQVGAGQRELAQRPLDELLLQFQEAQQAPFRPLGPLASLIQGTNIGLTNTLNPQRPSPVASGIAGALGGAALGGGLTSALGLGGSLGGYGGAAGTGLGAILGALGGTL